MSEYIHKSHNVSVLMYHFVCPAKYRRVVFSEAVDHKLKETCDEISRRYEISFLEIGADEDHVHFLVQSVPMYSPKKIVQTVKSITAREILAACPEVKKKLWGGSGQMVTISAPSGNTAMKKSSNITSRIKGPHQTTRRCIRRVGRGAVDTLLIPRSLLRGEFIFKGFFARQVTW